MRLTDYFSEVVAYVSYFLQGTNRLQQSYEQLKSRVNGLMSQSEVCVKKGEINHADYDLARFAICAWIDEAILNSAWDGRGQWQKEQLQRQYYGITDAGIEFYDRLNTVGLHQGEVREVYYLCLAMGFKGRYCHAGDEILIEQLKTSNLKLLTGCSVGLPSLEQAELFPQAYPTPSQAFPAQSRKGFFSPLTIACLVGPVIFLGVLFMVYRFILGNIGENFLSP